MDRTDTALLLLGFGGIVVFVGLFVVALVPLPSASPPTSTDDLATMEQQRETWLGQSDQFERQAWTIALAAAGAGSLAAATGGFAGFVFRRRAIGRLT